MLLKLFLLWTFVLIGRPQDFFHFLVPLRPALLMAIIVSATALWTGKIKSLGTIENNGQFKRYLWFYIILVIGVPFAVHRGQAFSFVIFQFPPKILFFYFFILLITTRKDLEKILYCLCISNLFYVGFGLLNSFTRSGRIRFGTMFDPNDLAYFLITLFPISFYFLSKKHSPLKRLIAVITILLSVVVSLMTGSRGGLLGLIAVGAILFFSRWSPFTFFHKVILVAIFAIALGLNADKIDTERLFSIFNPEDDYNLTSEMGRKAVWTRGLELTLEHPMTGVGAKCFPIAIGYYREDIGEIPRWQAAHSAFIQILTETGIIGFVVFLLLVWKSFLVIFHKAREKISDNLSGKDVLMGRVLMISFTGHLVTSLFLSQGYSILFTLFFAVSVVLQNISETDDQGTVREITPN